MEFLRGELIVLPKTRNAKCALIIAVIIEKLILLGLILIYYP
jgi:hypothetical protein